MKFEVDQDCAVKILGIHEGIRYEVSAHNFKDIQNPYDFRVMWATYLLLNQEQYELYKDRLDALPWNGGITYRRKIVEEHLDAPPEIAEKWNQPYYKIGDDFSHLWDHDYRHNERDRPRFERHIKQVIDALLGKGER